MIAMAVTSVHVPSSTTKYEVTGRGGKGRELMQRGGFTRVIPGEVAAPVIEGAS